MDRSDDLLGAARARLQHLRAALQAREAGPIELIETHISWILLGATQAWKLRKPVALPFVDFTRLAAREASSRDELRLNRRLAPDLYLGWAAITGPDDAPQLGPIQPDAQAPLPADTVDLAVCMRRFAADALWSERLRQGRLGAVEIDAMAERLARFHAEAPVAPPDHDWGSPAQQAHTLDGLIAALDRACALPALAGPARHWPALRDWLGQQLAALAPHWRTRQAAGHVREVHGDLHLRNVLWLDGVATAFDAIDFDPALRWIDPLQDLAFLAMDLMAHDRADLAWRLLDGWLAVSGDHAGLPAWRFYLVERALVRAQVAALEMPHRPGATPEALRYLRLAQSLARHRDPRLAVMHGLPGSGKSVAALALIERVGGVRLRSDVERKRLHGLAGRDRLEGDRARALYAAETTRLTYAQLAARAGIVLDAGWPAIVDAACLRQTERSALRAVARDRGCPAVLIDCEAPDAMLRERLRLRRSLQDDPSDADERILDQLAPRAEPLTPEERTHTLSIQPDTAIDRVAAAWQAQRGGPPDAD